MGHFRPPADSGPGRLVSSKDVVHIANLKAEETYLRRDPFSVAGAELAGIRTLLAVPMLKDDALIGAIVIYRQEVRPFTDKQIELLQNSPPRPSSPSRTRLLNELRQRTDDLTKSLEQQTATSEVLKVISSSPGNLEAVFQAMLEMRSEFAMQDLAPCCALTAMRFISQRVPAFRQNSPSFIGSTRRFNRYRAAHLIVPCRQSG